MREIKRLTRTQRPLTPAEKQRLQAVRASALQEAPEVIARERARQAAVKLLEEVKQAREDQQLSLQQIAERVGMDPSNIAKLENGQRENPTLDTLFRLAAGLGLQIELRLKKSAG